MKKLTALVILSIAAVATAASATESTCSKNISFAIAQDNQVQPLVPDFAIKWIKQNYKKYPSLCFSDTPNPRLVNYSLVFSTSQSAFNGLEATVRTITTTSTTTAPVSGTGSISNNYGSQWDYTYNGTISANTTTTTTIPENVPYTDNAMLLYVHGYDQRGKIVLEAWKGRIVRQGGVPANTLGYNLGSMIATRHFREKLLKQSIDWISKLN